jgi:hypothetical protein
VPWVTVDDMKRYPWQTCIIVPFIKAKARNPIHRVFSLLNMNFDFFTNKQIKLAGGVILVNSNLVNYMILYDSLWT